MGVEVLWAWYRTVVGPEVGEWSGVSKGPWVRRVGLGVAKGSAGVVGECCCVAAAPFVGGTSDLLLEGV